MPKFEGESERSNFQEALDGAVAKALASAAHTDALVSYVVERISGMRGGLAGFNKLTVVIDADLR
jgi:hypothetical protein